MHLGKKQETVLAMDQLAGSELTIATQEKTLCY